MQSTPVSGGAIVSDVMLIGQAPGKTEMRGGQPFAGRAGKTLFRNESVYRDYRKFTAESSMTTSMECIL